MTRQQRAVLVALLDGPIHTGNSFERCGVRAFSQRAGDLERMGYVVRGRVSLSETSQPVVQAELTDAGRAEARRLVGMESGARQAESEAGGRVNESVNRPPRGVQAVSIPGELVSSGARPEPERLPGRPDSLFPELATHDGRGLT